MRRLVLAVLAAGCSRSEPVEPASSAQPPPSVSVASAPASSPPAAASVVADATATKRAPITGQTRYPLSDACADPNALANEKKTLAPRAQWNKLTSRPGKFTLAVPPGIFVKADEADGLRLTSALKAGTPLGTRFFGLRVRRLGRSIDSIVGDKAKGAPLAPPGAADEVFPTGAEQSFTPASEESVGSGFAAATHVAGKPAYVWVIGGGGYNTDYVLVRVADGDTLMVAADWNSAIMIGQPECYQRTVIAGVVESIALE